MLQMNKYYFTTEISKLVNPPLHSKFFEKYKDSLENVYSSRRNAPLGCAPASSIPKSNAKAVFGVSTAKGTPAIDLMFSPKNKILQSVYSNDFSYKKCSDSIKPAGVKLENLDNSGEQVKDLLNYSRNIHSTVILPCSYAKKVHCNNRENCKNIEEKDHVIDSNRIDSKVKKFKNGLMDKYFVEMVWNLLKIKNHENFQDLVSAFKAYKNGNDKITLLDLQKICQKFGISAPLHILEKLLVKCDIIDKDGMLSYEEFMHSLNWKDLLPENHNFKNIKYANDWKEDKNNQSESLTDNYQTTTSLIGDHKHTVSTRIAGLPSYRIDVDRSKLKGISEFKEYGNASSMIQPNAFAKYGIFEEDLSELFSKEEIKSFLKNSGIKFHDRAFELVWQNVNDNGKASIGKVWNALKKNCLSFNQYSRTNSKFCYLAYFFKNQYSNL